MPPIQAILFDMDGTLIDSFPGIESAVLASLRRVCPETPHRFEPGLVGPPIREIFTRALEAPSPETLALLETAFRDLYDREGCLESVPYPGVREALATFQRQGVQAFIVTNKPSLPTRRILEALELTSCFVDAVSPDTIQPRFPGKAAATAYVMAKYGLDPASTLFVGDSEDDARAAAACGLRFVAARYGYGDAHREADRAIAAFPELVTFVSEAAGLSSAL